jgi:hypothetical protein
LEMENHLCDTKNFTRTMGGDVALGVGGR